MTTADVLTCARQANPATGAAILAALSGPRPAVAAKVRAAAVKGMNKTELRYHAVLTGLQRAGDVLWFDFDRLKLRLGDATFYTPDFFVVWSDGRLTFDEIKGFEQDDAIAKFKIAAAQFPMFEFRMFEWADGSWKKTRDMDVSARPTGGRR